MLVSSSSLSYYTHKIYQQGGGGRIKGFERKGLLTLFIDQKHLKPTSPDGCRKTEGACQQLSERKGACFLLNKKEALSGLIQVNDDEEKNRVKKQGESMAGCHGYRYLGVSNPGLQMLGGMSVMFPISMAPEKTFNNNISNMYTNLPLLNVRFSYCQIF